jgi:hypothetical protein
MSGPAELAGHYSSNTFIKTLDTALREAGLTDK